jgi:molybdenum cofactor biosynthesis protein B
MEKELTVHEEHKQQAPKRINIALIVVSTSRFNEIISKKKSSDETIPKVKLLLEKDSSIALIYNEIIPDSEEHIKKVFIRVRKDKLIDSIIFSGGTGLSPKDITYETLEPRLQKRFDGFGELFRNLSFNEIGNAAMLSRATAGIINGKRKNKSVFLLPGSPNAVILALKSIILPELGHIQYLINKKE